MMICELLVIFYIIILFIFLFFYEIKVINKIFFCIFIIYKFIIIFNELIILSCLLFSFLQHWYDHNTRLFDTPIFIYFIIIYILISSNKYKNTHKVWRKISNFAIYRKILIYIENYVLTKHKHSNWSINI